LEKTHYASLFVKIVNAEETHSKGVQSHSLAAGFFSVLLFNKEQEVIALLGLRLTSGQWRILRLFLAHPLLSDEELAAFLSLRRQSARRSLYESMAWAAWSRSPRQEE